MNKVFDKIIDKLEEIRVKKTCNKEKCDEKEICRICVVDDAIEIVNQEAGQYNVMIDGEYCFQSCGCTEMCGKCSRIANGDTDYYESICAFSDQYNNGWIPCIDLLPEESGEYLTWVEYDGDRFIAIDEIDCDGIIKEWNCSTNYKVIAWQQLPKPYQPKGE